MLADVAPMIRMVDSGKMKMLFVYLHQEIDELENFVNDKVLAQHTRQGEYPSTDFQT